MNTHSSTPADTTPLSPPNPTENPEETKENLEIYLDEITLPNKFPLVLIGNTGAGKSSILRQLGSEQFSESEEQTIGGSLATPSIQLDSTRSIKTESWDIGGAEKYRALIQIYYRQAKLALLVIASDDPDIQATINNWIKYTEDTTNLHEVQIVFLFNEKTTENADLKTLADSNLSTLKAYGTQHSYPVFPVNAKTNQNIKESFKQAILYTLTKNLRASLASKADNAKAEIQDLFDFSDYLRPSRYLFTHHWKRMKNVSAALKKLPAKDTASQLMIIDNQLDLLEGNQAPHPVPENMLDKRWSEKIDQDATKNFDKSGCYQSLFRARAQLISKSDRKHKQARIKKSGTLEAPSVSSNNIHRNSTAFIKTSG